MRDDLQSGQRAAIVAEARSWRGTRFCHGARVKGYGVDCGQFVIACFENCGLIPHVETGSYPPDWFEHRDDDRYLGFVRAHLAEITGPPAPGDVIVFHLGRCYAHGGIVTVAAPLTVVHARRRAGMVIEEPLRTRGELMRAKSGKPPLYFSFWTPP